MMLTAGNILRTRVILSTIPINLIVVELLSDLYRLLMLRKFMSIVMIR